MNYMELMQTIDSLIEQLKWTKTRVRSQLISRYRQTNIGLLANDQLLDFFSYLQSCLKIVEIPVGLFDEIEAYLQAQAANADGEASRLLMALEDLEIDRTALQITPESDSRFADNTQPSE
jgi:hypothetical protein